MEKTYGYSPLSYELISLLRSGVPDFEAAEELIRRGADVNDQGDDNDENVLSKILLGYHQSQTGDSTQEECDDCENDDCKGCKFNLNPNVGESMVAVIRFFLEKGFDVKKQNGKYGKQCLAALSLSSFDRYIIDATKILLEAYGEPIPKWDDDDDAPVLAISRQGNYQDVVKANHYLANIFEATCQIYDAITEDHPYSGIDCFESAVGKKITKVTVDAEDKDVFINIDKPGSKHDNCFSCFLYLMYDSGYFAYCPTANCWVDSYIPDYELPDVSDLFLPIINHTITKISFGHRTIRKMSAQNKLPFITYGQPIITLHFDNGVKLNFTINYGEAEKYISYFYFG